MSTPEYTTYKCELCHAHKPVEKVYDILDRHTNSPLAKWFCRECTVASLEPVLCCGCRTANQPLFWPCDDPNRISGWEVYCGLCISRTRTVQDILKSRDGRFINKHELGTGEPEKDASYTEAEWKKLSGEVV